ncbi:MAG: hypothetical protein ACP5G0_04025 [Desulfomonilia bacterium]
MSPHGEHPSDFTLELGPMGPIGEPYSILLRINRNCPWNRCLFCPVYKNSRFSPRTREEIQKDIDALVRTSTLLQESSWYMGLSGRISREVLIEAIRTRPELYGEDLHTCTPDQFHALRTLNSVANWLSRGARRVFLQDADALAMRPSELAVVLRSLKKSFPSIESITCYARSKTCSQRSYDDLKELHEAGLTMCFVGIESGCDEILSFMKKGVTKAQHIEGGVQIMASGLQMAAFIMPGLAGRSRLSGEHVMQTLDVLNMIHPSEVRVRSLAVIMGTPLFETYQTDGFCAPGEEQMIDEIGMIIEGLDFDCEFETLQMTNTLFHTRGRFSRIREEMLEKIQWFQSLCTDEKAEVILESYVHGGYLDFVQSWGRYDDELRRTISEAQWHIATGGPDALARAERAVFMIKSRGIP